MTTLLKTRIIKIGNSQGIRIPKPFLQQVGLLEAVEVEAQAGQLVIRPLLVPRYSWDEQFAAMAKNGDDQLLDGSVQTEWEASEWTW